MKRKLRELKEQRLYPLDTETTLQDKYPLAKVLMDPHHTTLHIRLSTNNILTFKVSDNDWV